MFCVVFQVDLDLMKTKLEKIERERSEYKVQCDKLENRVMSYFIPPS